MPRISEFFGIVIYMYYNDHLPPHFHADYAESEGAYTIETLELLRSELSRRAHKMVIEWASDNRAELRAIWDRAREQKPLVEVAN